MNGARQPIVNTRHNDIMTSHTHNVTVTHHHYNKLLKDTLIFLLGHTL